MEEDEDGKRRRIGMRMEREKVRGGKLENQDEEGKEVIVKMENEEGKEIEMMGKEKKN